MAESVIPRTLSLAISAPCSLNVRSSQSAVPFLHCGYRETIQRREARFCHNSLRVPALRFSFTGSRLGMARADSPAAIASQNAFRELRSRVANIPASVSRRRLI